MAPTRLALLLLCTALLAPAAQAVDGVLEINQSCADNTGCFPGDSAGLPVTITTSAPSRSIRLTSDLIVPNDDTDGIRILVPNVSIDLNGFGIIHQDCKDSTSASCTPSAGTGSGIVVILSTRAGVSVRNGSIVGMGENGLELGNQAMVRDVRVRWNRLDGIVTGIGGSVAHASSYQNGQHGIVTLEASTISDCIVYDNGMHGIDAHFGNTITANSAYENGMDGIVAPGGSTVAGNTAYLNGSRGIAMAANSGYHGNTVSNNTATVLSGVDAGGNVCNSALGCP